QHWQRVAQKLLDDGALAVSPDEFRIVTLTPSSKPVLKGEVEIRIAAPPPPLRERDSRRGAARAATEEAPYDETLFAQLRQLRMRLAREQGVPPYVVFTDVALRDMARKQPTTLEAF